MKRLRRAHPLTYAYAKEAGWEIGSTKNGHVALTKDGITVYASGSPSCSHADKNCRAILRRKDRGTA